MISAWTDQEIDDIEIRSIDGRACAVLKTADGDDRVVLTRGGRGRPLRTVMSRATCGAHAVDADGREVVT